MRRHISATARSYAFRIPFATLLAKPAVEHVSTIATAKPIDPFKGWRIGSPPLWYPTHSTAYYVGVTGKRFTSVSCVGFRGNFPSLQPGANRHNNPFSDEIALFRTRDGGASRMSKLRAVRGRVVETGRSRQAWSTP